jgi:hypothetical protein
MEHEERLKAALANRYLIESELGEGGMATVFLAQDLRHGRRVAIKVFRPELAVAVGPERFLSEIRTTASLQHPHILQLFDSGQADGLLYYVMPFVDGESLRNRIHREGQLLIEDAVRIATEVAHALDAAHAAGFVHRDVKPENILLGSGGAVIADFGIALAISGADTERLTKTGFSMGTPEYMSPEQATGDQKVDARTDVYALGCVLYEMLVGEPPHGGRSMQSIVAAIMSGEVPSPRLWRGTVPPNVDAAARCAIERLPADRFDSCGSFAAALADPRFRHGPDPTKAPERSLRRWKIATAFAVLALLLSAGSMLRSRIRQGVVEAPPVSRFSIPVMGAEGYAANRSALAISPRGSYIAYIDGRSGSDLLFLRARDQLESWVVPGSNGAVGPFFSIDGESVGYATTDGLFKVPLTGGTPIRIVGFPEPRGAHWMSDDWIWFGSYSGLWRVREDGSGLEQVTSLRAERGESIHSSPFVLAGSGVVLFTIGRQANDEFEIAAYFPVDDRIQILTQGTSPLVRGDHLLYGRSDGTLMVAPLDRRMMAVSGPPEVALEGIVYKPGVLEYGLSDDGVLACLAGAAEYEGLVLVDRNGREEVLSERGDNYSTPRFSPDGRRLSVGVGVPPTRQVWIMDLGSRTMTPLTFEGHNYYGIWAPDGSAVTFAQETGPSVDIWTKPSDGSGSPQPLLQDGAFNYPETWAPDGETLLVRVQEETGLHDIYALDMSGSSGKTALLDQPPNEEAPVISPDGRWLAYASDLSGRLEVYLTTFPQVGGRRQISLRGGTEPVWARSGRELFYWRGDTLVAARVDPGSDELVLARSDLLVGPYRRWPFHASYDVSPDGDRFAMIRPQSEIGQQIVVTVNWTTELDRVLREQR